MTLRISGGRKLLSPPGEIARPTASRVRLAVMNLLAPELPGCRWLDLCCGSGVMACEALQRGVAEVVAVERDRRVAAVAQGNLELVAASLPAPAAVTVVRREVLQWLTSQRPSPFNLIYCRNPMDPAGREYRHADHLDGQRVHEELIADCKKVRTVSQGRGSGDSLCLSW